MQAKVGIIIPIYNTQDYLEHCLNSVINQTHKDLEIILVNDGSTNKLCQKIAMEYASKDARITLIAKENGGQSTARNAGLDFLAKKYELEYNNKEQTLLTFKVTNSNPLKITRIYKSENSFDSSATNILFTIPQIDFLHFLDSDDWWALDCVESCLQNASGVDIVWYAGNAWFGQNRYNFDINTQVIDSQQWLQNALEKGVNYFWCVNYVMISWSKFKKLNLRFINGIIFEDHIFSIMLFAQCEKIHILRKRVFYYRVRPNSTSNHNRRVTAEQISPYFAPLLESFAYDFEKTKAYFKAASVLVYVKNLVDFIQNFLDPYKQSLLKQVFLEYYLRSSLVEFSRIDKDPLNSAYNVLVYSGSLNHTTTFDNASKREILSWVKWICQDKISEINALKSKLVSVENSYKHHIERLWHTIVFDTAVHRIHKHLAYKLGSAMILNSKSLWGYIRMPYVLSFIKEAHKKEIADYEARVAKNPSLKLPKLESYADYKEALKEKECFTYKLGEALIKANSVRGGGEYLLI